MFARTLQSMALLGALLCTCPANAEVEPISKFSTPAFAGEVGPDGKQALWTAAYSHLPGGYVRLLFGCHAGQYFQMALQTDPKSELKFAYKFEPETRQIAAKYVMKLYGNDDLASQLLSGVPTSFGQDAGYRDHFHLPLIFMIATVQIGKLSRHHWDRLRVSAELSTGKKATVEVKRDDPQLQAFFEQCRLPEA